MVRRPVLDVEKADSEKTVKWSSPANWVRCRYLRVPMLYKSEHIFWRVHSERARPKRCHGRINRPLLDSLPAHGHANEGKRTAGKPGEETTTYRNHILPADILQSHGVIALFYSVQVLPHIRAFLDPLPTLLQATREVWILDQACGKEFKSVLQKLGRGDQIGEGLTDLV